MSYDPPVDGSPASETPRPVYGDARDLQPVSAVFRTQNGYEELVLTELSGEEKKGQASKTHALRLRAIERAAEILEKRVNGWTIRQLALEYEVSQGTIGKILNKEFEKTERRARQSSDVLRQLHEARLEAMYKAMAPAINKGVARAVEMGLKILERHAKLTGLDAPEKKQVDVTVTHTDSDLIAAAERLGLPVHPSLRAMVDGDVIDAEFTLPAGIHDRPTEETASHSPAPEGPEVTSDQSSVPDAPGPGGGPAG